MHRGCGGDALRRRAESEGTHAGVAGPGGQSVANGTLRTRVARTGANERGTKRTGHETNGAPNDATTSAKHTTRGGTTRGPSTVRPRHCARSEAKRAGRARGARWTAGSDALGRGPGGVHLATTGRCGCGGPASSRRCSTTMPGSGTGVLGVNGGRTPPSAALRGGHSSMPLLENSS